MASVKSMFSSVKTGSASKALAIRTAFSRFLSASSVRPAHSIYDGDTVFALCSGRVAATPDSVGVLAAKAAEAAIVDAIRSAATYGDYLSCTERLERLSR